MKLSWLLLLLMPTISFAESLGIPSINSVPLFWGITNNDPKYKAATSKAQEAFFIQTGIARSYSMFTGYFTGQATKFGQQVETKTAAFIDDNTPFNSKYIIFAAAISYTALVKKEVTRNFRNPIFHNVMHTVTIGERQQYLGIEIPF